MRQSDIDFETSHSIIVNFSYGCTGKFIVNCLGLSDDAILLHHTLAEKQLAGDFNTKQKYQFLIDSLNAVDTTKKWNDLNLSGHAFLGIGADRYSSPSYLKIHDSWSYNSSVGPVTQAKKFFFYPEHYSHAIEGYLSIWKNSKIIFFNNCREWISFLRPTWKRVERGPVYTPYLREYWNTIRGEQYPLDPPQSLDEVKKLPKDILDELESLFEGRIYDFFEYELLYPKFEKLEREKIYSLLNDNNATYYWNALDISNAETFLTSIKKLYKELELSLVDDEYLLSYRIAWLNAVAENEQRSLIQEQRDVTNYIKRIQSII